jgi:hypothetical protein
MRDGSRAASVRASNWFDLGEAASTRQTKGGAPW